MGGITPEKLGIAFLELVMTAIRLTAIGIMCSAAARTTGQALVATYCLILMTCMFEQSIQYDLIIAYNEYGSSATTPAVSAPQLTDLLSGEPGLLSLLRSPLILSLNEDIPFGSRITWGGLPSLLCSLMFLPLARWLAVPPVH